MVKVRPRLVNGMNVLIIHRHQPQHITPYTCVVVGTACILYSMTNGIVVQCVLTHFMKVMVAV